MSRFSRGDKTPRVKPVQKIELSEKNIPLRIALVALCIAIAALAIGWGVSKALNVEPGWQMIEVDCETVNCSQDFVLNYDFSDSGNAATTQLRLLTILYSDACEKAYWLFSPDQESEDFGNMCSVNRSLNKPVQVDPVLYEALEVMVEHNCRELYLAPVYALYDDLISSDSDVMAAEFDPARNRDLAGYAAQVAEFAADPKMIDLELLEDHQVRLRVSDAYLAFAAEYEITVFADFHWMTNAFITDYMADLLLENGFTTGYIASNDGFTRNLDTRGNAYSMNIFNRLENQAYMAGQMVYRNNAALVSLRDYPMSERDQWSYYRWSDGHITNTYVDISDGCSKAAVDTLVTYAYGGSCAEVLLEMLDVYIAEELEPEKLADLADRGLYSVWCENRTVCYNEAALEITGLYEKDGIRYTARYTGK